MNTDRVPNNQQSDNRTSAVTELRRIADALGQLVRLYDERTAAELNARYPFGKPADRWRRGA
jgi:hypothetical protein